MALMFEYAPGMDLTQPWPFTVTRPQPGYRVNKSGVLVQMPANTLRDNHYVGGVRTALFEPSAINSCFQSQALATTPWGGAEVVATNNAYLAPDGTMTATGLVPTANNVGHSRQQIITITANEFYTFSVWLEAKGYNFYRLKIDNGGNGLTAYGSLASGTIVAGAIGANGVLSGSNITAYPNGRYLVQVWGKTGGAATTVTCNIFPYDTLANAQNEAAFIGDTVSGIAAWGVQVERNGTTIPQAPTSYMPTTVAASSARGADAASTPWPFKVQPMWCYTSWYDLGMCQRAQSSFAVTITPAAAADPQWVGLFGGVGSDVRSSWISGAGSGGAGNTNRNTAAVAVSPAYGDFVETYARVLGDGSTLIAARRNGGTITVGAAVGPTGGVPFVDFAANPLLWLGFPGETIAPLIGLTRIKIGADPARITTLAQAALV